MATELRPYPAYKDSGLPWLGSVPERWEVVAPKRMLQSRSAGAAPIKNTASPEPRASYVPAFSASGQDVWLPSPMFHGPGLVLSAVGARCGKTFKADGAWAIVATTHVLMVRHSQNRDYWWYVTNNEAWWERAGAAQPFVQISETLDRRWAVPPLPDQAAIVRYLDHADQKVRHAIRARQQLIKLLTEQKQAIIQRAVTRGLDPSVRLKPSGIPWLGDIPEHWTLKRFKFLTRIASGQVDPREPKNRGRILIAPNHIESGTGRITHLETAQEQGADSGKYEVHQGQIIYSKIRPNLCKAAIAPMDCLCSADMYPIGVRETELRTAYVLRLLLSAPFTKYAVGCSLRVAMPKVNREALGECPLWYPNLEEQDAILQFLERATSPLDVAIGAARRGIDLLREYRTRLIADVVTGKLDVRDAAAHLPDEPEEQPEPLDEGPVAETSDLDAEESDGDQSEDESRDA